MISQYKHIYMVGIKGVGMTSLAVLLTKWGKKVTGSDTEEIFQTDDILKEYEIHVLNGFVVENIPSDTDLVITTGAHNGLENVEVIEAKRLGIPVLTHAQALGEIMKEFKHSIAVSGSHGKTTTTAFITHVLSKLNYEPASIIGSAEGINKNLVDKNYIVVEADEYVASPGVDMTPRFQYLNPEIIVCTNIEFDHPDVYEDLNAVKNAFTTFFKKVEQNNQGKLIACSDDEELKKIIESYPKDKVLTYGFKKGADLLLSDARVIDSKTYFNAMLNGEELGDFELSLFGDHNVLNAGAVLLVGTLLHLNVDRVREIMTSFKGAKRRFELIYEKDGTFIFDDYAHHPSEIRATIKAFKDRFPDKRIIVLFQPHTISRTLTLKNEFITSLSQADLVYITDIFVSAREDQTNMSINSVQLVEDAQRKNHANIFYAPQETLLGDLQSIVKQGDVIVTMGAGDIYKMHSDIIRAIK